VNATRELLRRLAANDECSLRAVIAPGEATDQRLSRAPGLDARTRVLVELAALLAVDATTTSLRWAVDRACAMGADDETLVHVLLATGWAAGTAQAVAGARRLALALDFDLEADTADVTRIAPTVRAAQRPTRARPLRTERRRRACGTPRGPAS